MPVGVVLKVYDSAAQLNSILCAWKNSAGGGTKMQVFTRDLLKDFEYAPQKTPEYEFLNRCPRAEVETIRNRVEDWFDRIPDGSF
jgi:hypothetical protein